jgi:hypothetical protein
VLLVGTAGGAWGQELKKHHCNAHNDNPHEPGAAAAAVEAQYCQDKALAPAAAAVKVAVNPYHKRLLLLLLLLL